MSHVCYLLVMGLGTKDFTSLNLLSTTGQCLCCPRAVSTRQGNWEDFEKDPVSGSSGGGCEHSNEHRILFIVIKHT